MLFDRQQQAIQGLPIDFWGSEIPNSTAAETILTKDVTKHDSDAFRVSRKFIRIGSGWRPTYGIYAESFSIAEQSNHDHIMQWSAPSNVVPIFHVRES